MRAITTSNMPGNPMEQPPHVPALVLRSSGGDRPPVAMGGTAIERSMVTAGSIAVYDVKPAVVARASASAPAHKALVPSKHQAVFSVHVQNAITGRSWIVHRRFSDFTTLRTLIDEHFSVFHDEFPRLGALVGELYFPRKHKFLSKLGRVVEHRCDAFLEYLVRLHRLLISREYMLRSEISTIGLSILRGFLGSSIVQDPAHKAYPFHKPIRPTQLKPSERSPVHQCGSLHTVIEDDQEMEAAREEAKKAGPKVAADEEIPREDSTNSTDVDSLSEDMTDREDDELDGDDNDRESSFRESSMRESCMRESQLVDRRRSYKYARNRKVLLFLKKDMFGSSEETVRSPSAVEDTAVVDCGDNAKALAQLSITANE